MRRSTTTGTPNTQPPPLSLPTASKLSNHAPHASNPAAPAGHAASSPAGAPSPAPSTASPLSSATPDSAARSPAPSTASAAWRPSSWIKWAAFAASDSRGDGDGAAGKPPSLGAQPAASTALASSVTMPKEEVEVEEEEGVSLGDGTDDDDDDRAHLTVDGNSSTEASPRMPSPTWQPRGGRAAFAQQWAAGTGSTSSGSSSGWAATTAAAGGPSAWPVHVALLLAELAMRRWGAPARALARLAAACGKVGGDAACASLLRVASALPSPLLTWFSGGGGGVRLGGGGGGGVCGASAGGLAAVPAALRVAWAALPCGGGAYAAAAWALTAAHALWALGLLPGARRGRSAAAVRWALLGAAWVAVGFCLHAALAARGLVAEAEAQRRRQCSAGLSM